MYFDIITSGKINDSVEKNVKEKSNLKNEARLTDKIHFINSYFNVARFTRL